VPLYRHFWIPCNHSASVYIGWTEIQNGDFSVRVAKAHKGLTSSGCFGTLLPHFLRAPLDYTTQFEIAYSVYLDELFSFIKPTKFPQKVDNSTVWYHSNISRCYGAILKSLCQVSKLAKIWQNTCITLVHTALCNTVQFSSWYVMHWGMRWRSGWGTALQTGRSRVWFPMVSLDFFIDIILPVALWPWGSTQPLTEMSTRNISWGVKAAGA
jgi:hypothetical protein